MSASSINQFKDYDGGDLAGDAWTLQQLKAKGVSIEIQAKWWGYTIEMNDKAVDILEHCLDWLEDRFKKHFKETKLRRAISLCVQFKKDRLVRAVGAAGSNSLVRMVSPWIIPFALVVVRGGMKGDDYNLWFTVWDNDKETWGEDSEFHECMTRNAPALAQHGDFLYCVHRGYGDDNLWWTVYSTNNGWSDDTVFPKHHTELNPSLVDFENTLYCFHRGAGGDHALYYCTFDTVGKSWNPDEKIKVEDFFYSNTGCAVAVYNEELHLVYQVRAENTPDNKKFRHLIFKNGTWRNSINNPIGWTADTPALVAYQDKLLMVHRGDGDECMYYGTYDGTSWSKVDQQIPNMSSKYGPGLAVFDNKVFMAHRGHGGDENLYYSTYDGKDWKQDTKFSDKYTGAPPALACYNDPQCNSDNYEDLVTEDNQTVKTYLPRLICVHRGWG